MYPKLLDLKATFTTLFPNSILVSIKNTHTIKRTYLSKWKKKKIKIQK